MSETNQSPEHNDEQAFLGREILEGVESLVGDVFLRSELPLDTKYSGIKIEQTPEEDGLEIQIFSGGSNYRVHYRPVHEGHSVAATRFSLNRDGTYLSVIEESYSHGKSRGLNERQATQDLITKLPDFKTRPAKIIIDVPAP